MRARLLILTLVIVAMLVMAASAGAPNKHKADGGNTPANGG